MAGLTHIPLVEIKTTCKNVIGNQRWVNFQEETAHVLTAADTRAIPPDGGTANSNQQFVKVNSSVSIGKIQENPKYPTCRFGKFILFIVLKSRNGCSRQNAF